MKSIGKSKLSHRPFSLISPRNSDLCWNSYPHSITQPKYTVEQGAEALCNSPAGPPAARSIFGNLWTGWGISLCHKRGRRTLNGKRLSHTKVEEGPLSWKMFLIAALFITGSEGWQNTLLRAGRDREMLQHPGHALLVTKFHPHIGKWTLPWGTIQIFAIIWPLTLLHSKNKRAHTTEILLALTLL